MKLTKDHSENCIGEESKVQDLRLKKNCYIRAEMETEDLFEIFSSEKARLVKIIIKSLIYNIKIFNFII